MTIAETQPKANYCWGCGYVPWNDGTRCGCKGGPTCGYCANGKPEQCADGICRQAPRSPLIACRNTVQGSDRSEMVTTRAAYRTTRAVCEHCGIKFKAYRVTAKYCCESCKQRAKRERGFRTAVQAARELVRAEIQVLPEDPNRCRSCGHTGIARDASGQEFAGGAHVATKTALTGLCWFCWKETPEGVESMARLQTVLLPA